MRRVIRWLIRYLLRLDDSLEGECRGDHARHSKLSLLVLAARALRSGPGELSIEDRRKLGDLRVIRREDQGD